MSTKKIHLHNPSIIEIGECQITVSIRKERDLCLTIWILSNLINALCHLLFCRSHMYLCVVVVIVHIAVLMFPFFEMLEINTINIVRSICTIHHQVYVIYVM